MVLFAGFHAEICQQIQQRCHINAVVVLTYDFREISDVFLQLKYNSSKRRIGASSKAYIDRSVTLFNLRISPLMLTQTCTHAENKTRDDQSFRLFKTTDWSSQVKVKVGYLP